jgi:hypothetical protein
MPTRSLCGVRSVVVLGVSLGCLVILNAWPERTAAQDSSVAQTELAKLKNANGNFSVTVLPPLVPKFPVDQQTRVLYAKGVAMLLERAGVKTIEVSDHEFHSKSIKCGDLESLVKAVPEYLRQNSVETDYVYAAVFCGTPDTGAMEILTVITDRNGQVVWKKHQDAKDEFFREAAPKDPLATVYVSLEPFRQAAGLIDPTGKGAKTGGPWDTFFTKRQQKAVEGGEN